jgi:hypothetical protein
MQLIYIARMLHRSLDLLVDAPRILRNLQQSAVIRSCRLVFGVTDPDRKIRLYNSACIVNTAGERRSPTDPWRLFGFIAHFVRALDCLSAILLVASCPGFHPSREPGLIITPFADWSCLAKQNSDFTLSSVHSVLMVAQKYFGQARPLPSRAGSRLRCPSPPCFFKDAGNSKAKISLLSQMWRGALDPGFKHCLPPGIFDISVTETPDDRVWGNSSFVSRGVFRIKGPLGQSVLSTFFFWANQRNSLSMVF